VACASRVSIHKDLHFSPMAPHVNVRERHNTTIVKSVTNLHQDCRHRDGIFVALTAHLAGFFSDQLLFGVTRRSENKIGTHYA
jgi:hypothetical protein